MGRTPAGALRLGAALRGGGTRTARNGRGRAPGGLRRVGERCPAVGPDTRALPAAAVRPRRELPGRAGHVPGGRDGWRLGLDAGRAVLLTLQGPAAEPLAAWGASVHRARERPGGGSWA